MAKPTERSAEPVPLGDVPDDELSALVDAVLRSGVHHALPSSAMTGAKNPGDERHHARVIAEQIQQLASSLRQAAGPEVPKEQWYFEVNGRQVGPVDLHQVRRLWEDGEIGPDSYCWHDGFSAWIALSKVTQLAAALAPKEGPRDVPPLVSARDEEARGWKPHADALRKTLPEATPPPQAPKSPATPTLPAAAAGAVYVLSAPVPPQPPPPAASTLAHSIVTGIVTGVVAGLVIAAALLAARASMPPSRPSVLRGTSRVESPQAPAPAVAAVPAVPEPAAVPTPAPTPPPPAKPPAERDTALVKHQLATEIPQEPKPTVYIPPAPALPERLGQADVLSVVAAHRSDIQRCIDEHLPEDTEGRLVIRWTIHPDGTVSDASVVRGELRDSELARCFLGLVSSWTFPKHSAAMEPVEIPFVF